MSIHRVLWKNLFLPITDLLLNTRIRRCRRLLEKTQWLSPGEIERLQLARLRGIVSHAYRTVPYYRCLFRQIGLRPEEIKDLSDLDKIPLLTREILSSKNKTIVSTSYHSARASQEHTSGTTVIPVPFLRDKSDRSWGLAAALRAYSWAGYEMGDKEAQVWASASIDRNRLLGYLYDKARRTLLIDATGFSTKRMGQILNELEEFDPDFIRGYSGALHHIAEELHKAGRVLKARGIISTASLLHERQREVMRESFGGPVFDFYGSREVMAMAAECEERSGLHILSLIHI